MKSFSRILLILSGLLFAGAVQFSWAQNWEDSNYAVLFSEENYIGTTFRLVPGAVIPSVSAMGGRNWTASRQGVRSIEIHGNIALEVWDETQFRGESYRITQSASNLDQVDGNQPSWSDRIASVKAYRLDESGFSPSNRVSNASGGRDNSRRSRAGEVKIFSDANYRGDSLAFNQVQTVADLKEPQRGSPGWNDRISSIHINGPYTVILYQDANFRGDTIRITQSVSNMHSLRNLDPARRNWNDSVSSMEITASHGFPDTGSGPSGEVAGTLFEHDNYNGKRLTLINGQDIPNLKEKGWNDLASSIMVEPGYTVVLYKDANFQGQSIFIANHKPDLGNAGAGRNSSGRWNDQASSLKVYKNK